MVADYIGNVIEKMIEKTKQGVLKWKPVEKLNEWDHMKHQIIKTRGENLKYYIIDDTKSYAVHKGEGYVMVLNIRYSNALVFSPALDRYILVVKINDELMPQNLSNYDAQGYRNMLQELVKEIEYQRNKEFEMPECLYNFLEEILGGD